MSIIITVNLSCNTVTSVTVQMILTQIIDQSGLTAAALAVLLQQLSLRTDAVVRSWSAHTLVLTAVLHRVTHVHVCKHTVNKHILHISYTCTNIYRCKQVVETICVHLHKYCTTFEGLVRDYTQCLLCLYFNMSSENSSVLETFFNLQSSREVTDKQTMMDAQTHVSLTPDPCNIASYIFLSSVYS